MLAFRPIDQWSFVMAHEFFDALPIHSFEVITLNNCKIVA